MTLGLSPSAIRAIAEAARDAQQQDDVAALQELAQEYQRRHQFEFAAGCRLAARHLIKRHSLNPMDVTTTNQRATAGASGD